MATTTFCDIKMTEDITGYTYENKEYNWEKGDIVSLPYHTASRFVNKWNQAEWAKEPYEVRDEDYEHVLGAENKESEKMAVEEHSYEELQQVAKEHDIKANQSRDELVKKLNEEVYE